MVKMIMILILKLQHQILLQLNIQLRTLLSRPPIGYKLIEAGGAKDMLQKQGLSIDGLNNNKDTTLQ